MAEGKETKPRSFRIDDATAEKFKEIAASIGGNQQEALVKLIEVYEFQAGKAGFVEKKADITRFEKHVNVLMRMYMDGIEENQSLNETIRADYDALLKSKDMTIQELQGQLVLKTQLQESATQKARECMDEIAKLKKEIGDMDHEYRSDLANMRTMLTDKENLNKVLTDSCDDLKVKVEGMRDSVEQFEKIQGELEKLKSAYAVMEQEKSELENRTRKDASLHETMVANLKQQEKDLLERQREQLQIAHEKAVLEAEKRYQEQIQKLKEEKQAEVDKYQNKYFELLERMQELSMQQPEQLEMAEEEPAEES